MYPGTAPTALVAALLAASLTGCSADLGRSSGDGAATSPASSPGTSATSATAAASSRTPAPAAAPVTTAASTPPAVTRTTPSSTAAPATTPSPAPTTAAPSPSPAEPAAEEEDTSAAAPVTQALGYGSAGGQVLTLQKELLRRGFWLPEADGSFGGLTLQAVLAAQKSFGLSRTGLADARLMTALKSWPTPALSTSGGKAVEIDLARQTLTLVRNGQVVAIFNTSTGNGERFTSQGVRYIAVTPTGWFQVQSTYAAGWQTGPLGKMYKPAYFNGGIAFHGSAEIPAYPASHGCARLSRAGQDYVWSLGYHQVGTTVVVR